jgi:hypothetical protein
MANQMQGILEDVPSVKWPRLSSPDETGGPEIAQTLKGTMDDVELNFRSWSSEQKIAAADAVHSIFTGGKAWDIAVLASIGFGQQHFQAAGKIYFAGSGKAARTIAFRGKCYYAGSANYALWGKLNRLCRDFFLASGSMHLRERAANFELWNANVITYMWKASQYLEFGGIHQQEAAEFTAYGFNSFQPHTALPWVPSGEVVQAPMFEWQWLPNRD